MQRPLRKSCAFARRESGFGLVEMLCALVLLSVGVLAVIAMFESGVTQLRRASTLTTAGAIAESQMEKFRELRFDALGVPDSLAAAADATYKADPAFRADASPTTTLASALSASATSLAVASASGFPANAPFRVKLGSEIILVSRGAGTTQWTVTRGVDGTVAGAYAAGTSLVLKERVSVAACGSPPCTTIVPTTTVAGADGRSYRVDSYATWRTVDTTGGTGRQVKLMTVVVRDSGSPGKVWARASSSFDEATGL
ncbi:MAG: prepilin-type N-terminal cleavage/methylation domain-containing protein [Actinomycetota bacterium]|nr:prepilin-type N-terminal cleavage/methylation domain-containing protein [Actinomycetota bacterium]